jgi:hypothetical protein
VAAIVGAVLGSVRVDRHAADRIDDAASCWYVVMMLAVMLGLHGGILLRNIP